MSMRHGGAFFMSGPGFPAYAGPWSPAPFIRRLAQAAPPSASSVLTPEIEKEWALKLENYMRQVQAIQDYVKAHPSEAAAVGLDKDAANLPASGSIDAYPRLKAVHDKLVAGQPVTAAEIDCVPALEAALLPANQKLAQLQAPSTIFTPTNIGIGAGILALAVGLVVLS